MDTICPKQLEKFIYLRTNGQQEIVQSLPLLATTWDWHSQCLRKQLGVLGYPTCIKLDNGQALAVMICPIANSNGVHPLYYTRRIYTFCYNNLCSYIFCTIFAVE